MRTILTTLMFPLIFACNDAGKNEVTTDADSSKETSPAAPASSSDCYVSILQRDTMVACLEETNGDISGRLTFDNYEKDGSSGDVHGTINKDTIKLWYDFNSEGMRSVMEVYFLKDGNKLLRGIGDVGTKGDTAYFTNKSGIRYVSGNVFEKQDCGTIDEKYRCKD